jgi:transcriptional regulator with PAS, ATPase and Fis domain
MHSVPVLITGESGTGKEMFARAIWKAGPRKDKPFEAINCAALPANLLEAELFGYKKGAFTGAIKDRDGAFKRLNGGTLFLDEIGECSLELQAKLLRVLQPPPGKPLSYREFYPVGSDQPEHSDVRVIAATNRNLPEMIAQQQFRDDLFYRLSAISLPLPSLRERKEDILLLAETLLARINDDFRRETPGYEDKKFCDSTKKVMKNYPWYGNVRELFNSVLQGVVMASEKNIKFFDMGLSEAVQTTEKVEICDGFNLDNTLESIEKQYILSALKQSGGNKSKAARLLGFSNYQRLDAQIKSLKIQPELE